jgi:nucleotide-binding universal stress UspA family protein
MKRTYTAQRFQNISREEIRGKQSRAAGQRRARHVGVLSMIRDLLICLEGSPGSERATELAIEIARESSARLLGLAIVDEPDIRAGAATSIGGASFKQHRDEVLLEDAQRHVQEYLTRFEARCRDAGVRARVLALSGRPAPTILVQMQSHDLTLIGRNANFLFETRDDDPETRDSVLHRAGKPVIIVPEVLAPAGPDVLVAFDGSSAAKRALKAFAASGLAQGRKVHVASVQDDGEEAWEMASRGVELLRELGVGSKPRSVVSALPIAAAILDARRKVGAGLLVTGAYQARSRLSELVWGSVTHTLLEETPVPLFLHH